MGAKRNAMNGKRSVFYRISDDMLARLEKMQELETRRLLYPVSRTDLLRKCVEIGLASLEQTQKVKP